MKCPVCSKDMQVPEAQSQQDLYYDCEHCYSNLLIQGETCEILSESVQAPTNQPATIQDLQTAEKDSNQEPSSVSEKMDSQDSQFSDQNSQQEEVESSSQQEVSESSDNHSQQAESESLSQQEELENSSQQEESGEAELQTGSIPSLKEDQEQHLEDLDALSDNANSTNDTENENNATNNAENADENLEDFSDINQYGNQQDLSQESLFYYDLMLSEINSPEVRQEVESLLQDKGFQWELLDQEISIIDGRLEVKEMSPVKAYVFVKALMGLPLKISWRQSLRVD